MNKEKFYVVEGIHDEAHLRHMMPNIKTISVGGSEIKKDVLEFLVNYQDTFEFILIFDPDYAGERIRKKVSAVLKEPIHIFVERQSARQKNGKKIGVEHVSLDELKVILNDEVVEKKSPVVWTLKDLVDLKLTHHLDAKKHRDILSKKLKLGHVNSKTLIKRLTWLGVTKEVCKEIIDASS